jgi:uncharacterized delta-60 repeat protein
VKLPYINEALCLCILASPLVLIADEYYIEWADTIDNGYVDNAEDIAVDNSNNIIVTGYADMSGGYNYDYFTVKYDSNGTILWADTIDNGVSIARSVAVDAADNIIVTGYCIIGGYADYLTVKYDPGGTILWVDTIINARHDNALGVAVDHSNNIIVTGYSVMPGPDCDYFTVKYDPDGAILWQHVLDNRTFDYAFGVAVDTSNNIIVTGHSGDPLADYDYFTVKYDSSGMILWQDTSVGDVAYDVVVDNLNNIIVTGYCVGQNSEDYYTVKYDPDGMILWQDTLDNGSSDVALAVGTDNCNNIIVTGYSEFSDLEYFTVKYDSNGTIVWQDTIDNVGDDFAHGVAVDNSDNILVTGIFFINGNNDYCTVKYAPSTGISENEHSSFRAARLLCNIYPNPFSKLTTISFEVDSRQKSAPSPWDESPRPTDGIVSVQIYNISGCCVKSFGPLPSAPGPVFMRWDGTDAYGREVPSGIYFVHLENGEHSFVEKAILLR